MIRSIAEADIPDIVELGREFHGKSAWAGIVPFDAQHFANQLRTWSRTQGVAVFRSEHGFLVIGKSPLYFAEENVAYEVLFYAPDGRGDDLRRVGEAWAKVNGASSVLMGTHITRLEAMKRWFRLKGYRFFGMTFLKVM